MAKLKYRLERWRKTVLFQVIEMDSRFKTDSEYRASNGMRVKSDSHVKLNQGSVSLRLRNTFIDDVDEAVVGLKFFSEGGSR